MAITFACDRCGKRYEVADGLAGKRARCKQCGNEFKVPEPVLSAPRMSAPIPRHDPYALDETKDYPPRSAVAPDADEEFIPRRPSTVKRRKEANSGYGGLSLAGWGIVAGVLILVALVAALTSDTGAMIVGGVCVFAALVLMAVGAVWCMIVPFREDLACGLMYLFVPFYALYYLVTRWQEMKKPFLIYLAGVPMLVAGLLPAVHAAREAALRARLRSEQRAFAAQNPPRPTPPIPMPAPEEPAPAEPEPVAAAPAPAVESAPAADSAYDQHERFAKEVLARMNELADLLATVTDIPSARAAAPRYKALVELVGDDQRRYAQIPRLGMADDKKLGDLYADAIRAAVERYQDEVRRVQSIAGVSAFFTHEMLSFRPFVPGFHHIRIAPRGRTIPAPIVRPAPAPQEPETTLTLNVSNVPDAETRDVVGEQVGEIMKSFGGSWHIRSSGGGGRWTFTIWPLDDPQAFADRVRFGRVTRVSGRVIDMVANPLQPGERRPADADFVSGVLFDLKSSASNRRRDALRKLKNAPPTDRRDEVARAVRPLLKDPDGFTRSDAVHVLGAWGNSDDISSLIEVLKDPDFGVRIALFDTLKKLKDPKSAGPVADALPDGDRSRIGDVLKAIGPPAEDAVSKYLKHSDGWVRMEAANVLKEIGGEKSVPDLRRLAMTESGLDAMAARSALKKMAERGVNIDVETPKRPEDVAAPGKSRSKFGR